MSFFRRKRSAPPEVDEGAYAEAESNPELLAAEAAVNQMDGPPPGSSGNFYRGRRPHVVEMPEEVTDLPADEDPPAK